MSDKRSSVLRKVAALLAKADSTGFSEERDSLIAKADSLMANYAIEAYEIAQAQGDATKRTKPIIRKIPWSVYDYKDSAMTNTVYNIFLRLARHLRCEVGTYGHFGVNVVGYEEDIDFLELLYTSVVLHLTTTMQPHADPALSFEQNVALLKESGLNWTEVHRQLVAAKIMPNEPWKRAIGIKFTKVYTDYCAATGRDRMYTSPKTYRTNFAYGYLNRIKARLDLMAAENAKSSEGKELVLVSRAADIHQVWAGEFGMTEAARKQRALQTTHKWDGAAVAAGQSAANNADLSGGRNNLNNRKAL